MAYTRTVVGAPGCRWMMMYTCTCNTCELPHSNGGPCRLVKPCLCHLFLSLPKENVAELSSTLCR